MPTNAIIPCLSAGWPFGGVLHLPDALALAADRGVVLGLRVSGPEQVERGSLRHQEQFCRDELRKVGCRVVGVVGNDRHRRGQVSRERRDLLKGRELAKRHNAILCYRDLPRLFRPVAYDPYGDPDAEYTPEDFTRLWDLVGPGVVLAVIEPPGMPATEYHRRAVGPGMELARADGTRLGRPTEISSARARRILKDRGRGLSYGQIAEKHGMPRSTVQALINRMHDQAVRKWG